MLNNIFIKFTNLLSFKEYILKTYEEKMKEKGKISEDATIATTDINLFSNNEIIKECLGELGIDNLEEYFETMEEAKNNSTISEDEISNYENTPENTNEEINENKFISQYVDELLNQEQVKKLADIDGDGLLTNEEKYTFMEKMSAYDGDENNLSLADLMQAIDLINTYNSLDITEPEAEKTFEVESAPEISTEDTKQRVSTVVPKSYEVPKYDENGNLILENLSLDELNQELSDKQTALNETKELLNNAVNGTDEISLSLKQQEETAHQKLEEYKQQNDNELSKKLDEFDEKSNAKDEAEKAVLENEKNITLANATLLEKETALNNAINYEAGLQSTLSSLEAQLASVQTYPQQEEQKEAEQEIKAKIEALNTEITNAQNAIQQAQKEKELAQKEIEELEAQSPELNENLTNAKNALSIVEEEMKALEGYSEIEEYMNSYKEAKNLSSEYKKEMISKTKTAITKQTEEISKIEAQINSKELERAQAEYKYNPTAMEDVVSYFGEDYLSLLSEEEIKNLQKYIGESGMSNVGNMPSKCLQCSVDYMRKIQGSTAGYESICNWDKDQILKGIKETLDSGKPVSLMVTTQAGTRHFVTAIGYKLSSDATLKESDLLVIDTYNGEIDGMGGTGGEGGYRTLFAQDKGYRYDILKA